MTTETEIEADELASKRNATATVVMSGIAELLESYDPDNVLPEGYVSDMIWEVEGLLIDASYEIEELAADVASGDFTPSDDYQPMRPVGLAGFGDFSVAVTESSDLSRGVVADKQGWELPGSDQIVDTIEDPGSEVTT